MSTDNCFPVNPNITDPGMIPPVIEEPCKTPTSEVSYIQWWDISLWKLWQKVVVGVIILAFICLIAYMGYIWITERKKTKDNESSKKDPPKTEETKETTSGPDMSEILKAKSQLMAKKAEKESNTAAPETAPVPAPKEQIQAQIQEQERLKEQAIEAQRREAYAEAQRRHEARMRAEAQAHMHAQAQAQAQAQVQLQENDESTPIGSEDGSDRFEIINEPDPEPESKPVQRTSYPALQDESESEDERDLTHSEVHDEKNEDPVEDFLKREIY